MLEKRDITRYNEASGRKAIALISLLSKRITNKYAFENFRFNFVLRRLVLVHKDSASKDFRGKGIRDSGMMRIEVKKNT